MPSRLGDQMRACSSIKFGNSIMAKNNLKVNQLQPIVPIVSDYTYFDNPQNGLYHLKLDENGTITYSLTSDKINLRSKAIADIAVDAEWYYRTEPVRQIVSEYINNKLKNKPRNRELNWFRKSFEVSKYLFKQFTYTNDIERGNGTQITVVVWFEGLPLPTQAKELKHIIDSRKTNKGSDEIYIYVPKACRKTTIEDVFVLPPKIRLWFFSSPKDIEAAIGTQLWVDLVLANCAVDRAIDKKRNVSGKFTLKREETSIVDDEEKQTEHNIEIDLKDTFGMANSSLDKWMLSLGVNNVMKHLPSQYAERMGIVGGDRAVKGKMDEWAVNDPNGSFQYAVGDVILFFDLVRAQRDLINKVVMEAHGNTIPAYTIVGSHAIPRSSGSLVATTYENFLFAKKFPYIACSLLNSVPPSMDIDNEPGVVTYDKYRTQIERELKSQVWLKPDFDFTRTWTYRFHQYLKFNSEHWLHGLASASIPAYKVYGRATSFDLYGAIVQGGRCVNEWVRDTRYQQVLDDVLDPDMKGCYGESLSKFFMAFGGSPKVESPTCKEHAKTLGWYIDNHLEANFVPSLWVLYVSGTLSFEQDLIHSKVGVTCESIDKRLSSRNFEDDTPDDEKSDDPLVIGVERTHVGGSLVLARKEIKLGIVTSDVWEVLSKVCSNSELKEIRNLSVECAVYYDSKDELTIDELQEHLLNTEEHRQTGDKRSTKWCRDSMGEFIQPFIDYRKKLKSQVVLKGDTFDLLQNAVKLFINTTYGNLAAPYFPMGNTVIANNITARARVGVWMMSKAFLSVQSITDGGMFSWKEVAFLYPEKKEGKKPGLAVLANREKLRNYRCIVRAPLTDVDVYEEMAKWAKLRDKYAELSDALKTALGDDLETVEHIKQERDSVLSEQKKLESWLDNLGLNHVNAFWSHYGLSLKFSIEFKYENTGKRATWLKTADYLIVGCFTKSTYLLKCRGAHDDKHPKKMELWHNLEPEKYPKPLHLFIENSLLGLKDFQLHSTRYRYEGEDGNYHILTPGSSIENVVCNVLLSHGDVYETLADYKKKTDADTKWRKKFLTELKLAHIESEGDLEKTMERVPIPENVSRVMELGLPRYKNTNTVGKQRTRASKTKKAAS